MRRNQGAAALLVLLASLGCSLRSVMPESATKGLRKEFSGPREWVSPRAMARTSDAIYVVGAGCTDPQEPHWGLWKLDLSGNLLAEKIGDQEGMFNGVATDGSSVYATGYLGWPIPRTLYLVSFDLQGNVRWSREWEGSRTVNIGAGLCVSGDYIYVIGYAIYQATGGDVVVLKYSKSGNLIWEKTWGGGGDDCCVSMAAYQGRLYVVGATTSFPTPTNNFDGLVLVLDEAGNELAHYTWGGSGYEVFTDVDVGTDLYIAGSTASYGAGDEDVVVLKMGFSGNLIWNRTYGGSGCDEASAMDLDGEKVHVCAKQGGSPVYLQYRVNGSFTGAWGDTVDSWTDVAASEGVAYLLGYGTGTGSTRIVGILTTYVTTYNLTVNMPGDNYWASVEGVKKTGASSKFEVTYEEHMLEAVPQVVDGRTKLAFSRWSDGSTANPRPVKLTRDTEFTAIYKVTDVFVEVLTSYSTASTSRWVPIGTRIMIGVGQTVVDHGNGTRHVFSDWCKDGNLLSKASNTTLEVTTPVVLVTRWDTEHLVHILSDVGTASGGGWYLLGSTVTVSISPTIVEKDFFANYVFDGWKSDGIIVSASAMYALTVARPVNLTASWKTELNLLTVGGVGAGVLLVAVLVLLLAHRPRPLPPFPPPPA